MADLIENCRRHRGMIGLLTVLGALLLGARAQQQVFRLVGSDVTLEPQYTRDLKEIKWILNGRILVEIVLKPQEELIYNLPSDRTTINKTNGALTIRYLTTEDSGDYEAEVVLMNDSTKVTEIRLTVRDCPDQPFISVESTEDQFVVSCECFSPDVTYEWFNETRSLSESRSYAEPKKNGTLTCVVDNEVCNKSSSINFYIPEVKSVGYNVILVPQYTGDPSEIIWKVNGDNLVEMVLKPQVDFIFYRLQDRATISHTDGSLTINHLTIEDSGDYTAEVLVNNEYYYTEIRLQYSYLSEVIIFLIVVGVLFFFTILIIAIFLLLYYCCKEYSGLSGLDIVLIVFGVLSLTTIPINFIFPVWYYCSKKSSRLSGRDIAGIVFLVLECIPFIIIILWYYFYKKPNRLCGRDILPIVVVGVLSPFAFLIPFLLLWYYCCQKYSRLSGGDIDESERCITVQFCNDVKNGVDESQRLLEDHSKRIQSPRLTIRAAFLAEDGNFTADAVMSDGKPHRFTQDEETSIMIVFEDKGKTAQELVFKKDGVTQFEYAFSSLKLHASIITLEPEFVIVYDAEGEQSYRVNFRLEEHPESKSICCITFHPSNMTGKDKITWKKDSQRLNTGGDGIKCDPNGDLTIYNATSKDKGKYTVQCKDKKLVQEFILQL